MTYSIVARCPKTGAVGVAVQTHWFAVGASVPVIEPGVGAIATQSVASRETARAILSNLRAAADVEGALEMASTRDQQWDIRQIGAVNWTGQAATYTGSRCVPFASGVAANGVACQANLMENEGVPEAMLSAWVDNIELDIADRLLAALIGAESKGGDIRGRQSAAILVFDTDPSLVDPIFDLRVDDHPEPLDELTRLVRVARAYQRANRGDDYVAAGDNAAAMYEYQAAMELAPEIEELAFWHGLVLAESGKLDQARHLVDKVYGSRSQMRDLLPRLQDAGWVHLSQEAMHVLTQG